MLFCCIGLCLSDDNMLLINLELFSNFLMLFTCCRVLLFCLIWYHEACPAAVMLEPKKPHVLCYILLAACCCVWWNMMMMFVCWTWTCLENSHEPCWKLLIACCYTLPSTMLIENFNPYAAICLLGRLVDVAWCCHTITCCYLNPFVLTRNPHGSYSACLCYE